MKPLSFSSCVFILTCFIAYSQTQPSTRKDDKSTYTETYKILIIPFENKMYLSEIDHHINKETHLNQKQIRYQFRDGLNEQLYHAFKKRKFTPIDLMSDTAKYSKDLKFIYGNISYDYLKIPDQNNYTPPKKEKKEKGIQEGQIVAETDDENRFMNTRVLNPSLIPYLYKKYKTPYFVFINELDIKVPLTNPGDYSTSTSKRKIIVHYTVYSVDAKEINSGIVEVEADVKINQPSKIIKKYFFNIAETIGDRVVKQINKSNSSSFQK